MNLKCLYLSFVIVGGTAFAMSDPYLKNEILSDTFNAANVAVHARKNYDKFKSLLNDQDISNNDYNKGRWKDIDLLIRENLKMEVNVLAGVIKGRIATESESWVGSKPSYAWCGVGLTGAAVCAGLGYYLWKNPLESFKVGCSQALTGLAGITALGCLKKMGYDWGLHNKRSCLQKDRAQIIKSFNTQKIKFSLFNSQTQLSNESLISLIAQVRKAHDIQS